MNEAILIWLYISISDAITSAVVVSFVALVASGFSILTFWVNEDDTATATMWAKRAAIVWVSFLFMSSFIPSKEDIKYIIGGAAVWNSAEYLASSEEAKQIPDNILKAMNSFLEETQKEDK